MHTCTYTHSPSALTLSAICAIQRCDPENPAVFIALQLNSTFAVCTNVGSVSCKHLKIHTVGKRLRFCLFLPSIAIKAAYRRWDKQKYLYMCTEKTQDNFTLNTFFIFFSFCYVSPVVPGVVSPDGTTTVLATKCCAAINDI